MKYISLLRGINVGGQKKIRMADLNALYEGEGLENVVTYIQSGNVIFDSGHGGQREISAMLEAAIEREHGFPASVDVRRRAEWRVIIDNNRGHPLASRCQQAAQIPA